MNEVVKTTFLNISKIRFQSSDNITKLRLFAFGFMLVNMNELDAVWEQMLAQAIQNAEISGRSSVSEYLRLRAANDALRTAGCKWLFDSALELSNESNLKGIKLNLEREEPHRFQFRKATMAGGLIRFRYGLRSLTVEAGWTRTPGDGFIRGGGLACARISHFGLPKANADLMLIQPKNDVPHWFAVGDDSERKPFSSNNLREHFDLFLDLG